MSNISSRSRSRSAHRPEGRSVDRAIGRVASSPARWSTSIGLLGATGRVVSNLGIAVLLVLGGIVLSGATGCMSSSIADSETEVPDVPSHPEGELRILFIGNSLTYTNDLPGLVETIGDAAGKDIVTTAVAQPNFSLEDHWNTGIATVLDETEPHLVVMQQGPSSLPPHQVYLLDWTRVLTEKIREVGGEPALLMVWPGSTRFGAFPAVRDSYRNAALGVDGRFFPAGEAFLAAIEHPDLRPYGPDGFHPSRTGSIISALTVVRTIYPDALKDLPSQMAPGDGTGPTIDLGEDAETIFNLVEAAVAEFGI